MPDLKTNVLYYGDNLDILRNHAHFPDESVDLIYLDPPFNSKATYNVLFRETSGTASEAQIEAFEDTWHWGTAAAQAYEEVIMGPHQDVARLLKAMVEGLRHNDVTAYLTMMAVRLVELRRVLKPTGSIYLHCDPTAGPYLRVLMDAVFGPTNFRSEIVWRRSNAHSKLTRQFGPIHDTVLFFAKSDNTKFLPGIRPHYRRYIAEQFTGEDEQGPYRINEITGSGTRGGESGQPWRSIDITARGRHWAIPKSLTSELGLKGLSQHQKLDALADKGEIVFSSSGFPRYKQRVTRGVPYQDIWAYQPYTEGLLEGTNDHIDQDVKWLEDEEERLGYQTQKPMGLLERIISSSSDQNGIVLDPFCGCGTAVHAAQKLGRPWIGIDITHLAIGLIRRRMRGAFPSLAIEVEGEPKDLATARFQASSSPKQFEYWVVDKLDAIPTGGKGPDLDGVKPFMEFGAKAKRAVISVKGTKVVNPEMVREVKGSLGEDKPIGALVILVKPTKGMITQAAKAGFYESSGKKYPCVQILTVEEILDGKRLTLPSPTSPFAKTKAEKEKATQEPLL
ncbi:MAG: site-specific DNA-methyltransferase [Chloroflexi bacterium]|nr:site-specific DNA-methyltransferase [Chloroflexota bacterium]